MLPSSLASSFSVFPISQPYLLPLLQFALFINLLNNNWFLSQNKTNPVNSSTHVYEFFEYCLPVRRLIHAFQALLLSIFSYSHGSFDRCILKCSCHPVTLSRWRRMWWPARCRVAASSFSWTTSCAMACSSTRPSSMKRHRCVCVCVCVCVGETEGERMHGCG